MNAERSHPFSLAIDGPAACGKSAAGGEVARRLGVPFLDTGTMYRAIAWAAIQHRINPTDTAALTELTESADIRLAAHADGDRLLLDGADITDNLRLSEVDGIVSQVSAVSGVRRALVAQQRAIACRGAIVMSGRDIGTVVLPNASVKVFLTASAEVRAARRHAEMRQEQEASDYKQVLDGLRRRDRIDSMRDDSPLRQADDAVMICSDDITLEEVVLKILGLAQQC